MEENRQDEAALLFRSIRWRWFTCLRRIVDSWKNEKGEIIESCTILTTTPNELVGQLHDRMPVIVTIDKYEKWLDPDVEDYDAIKEIFVPYTAAKMREYHANPKLNNANNEDPSLAGPVEAIEPEQRGLF